MRGCDLGYVTTGDRRVGEKALMVGMLFTYINRAAEIWNEIPECHSDILRTPADSVNQNDLISERGGAEPQGRSALSRCRAVRA
jgi:hypothetical protein